MSCKEEKIVQKMFMENVPICCEVCGGKLKHIGDGIYKCQNCEHKELDDFGKVKAFLRDNGMAAAYDIHLATGVAMQEIEFFLKEGRLEIPEGSKFYIKCEKCGCALRYGRYCNDCALQLKLGLMDAFESIGEKPKYTLNVKDKKGKMYTYEDENKKDQ